MYTNINSYNNKVLKTLKVDLLLDATVSDHLLTLSLDFHYIINTPLLCSFLYFNSPVNMSKRRSLPKA